jgi:hypothetical protein
MSPTTSRLTITATLATMFCIALTQPSMAAAPRTVGTIQLSPQAEPLANPAQPGQTAAARSIRVKLTLLDTKGKPITRGALATPVRITIYGPSPAVLTTPTPVIRSATPTVTFNYDGGFVANSIFVTAVSGHAFAQMSFQPAHRGFPGTQSVPFTMKRDNVKKGWSFKMSVAGGRSRTVLMDTGSHGIVVPKSALGPGAVGPGPPGHMEYSSDGKVFSGNDYLAPVTISVGSTKVTTVPIKVLAISSGGCAPHFPKCDPAKVQKAVHSVSMLGVGFDRGKQTNTPSPSRRAAAAASETPPELANAFLALKHIVQGSMHPGYIITPKGVTLGITAADSAGFSDVSLTPGGTGPGDWNGAPGCFSFPGIRKYKSQCGTVLVDTGIASAILALPKSQRPASMKKKIPKHTKVQISVGTTGAAPAFTYGFTTGGSSPVTPTSIRWAAGSPPFVNTGRDVISQHDYLFDAGSGRLGFRSSR